MISILLTFSSTIQHFYPLSRRISFSSPEIVVYSFVVLTHGYHMNLLTFMTFIDLLTLKTFIPSLSLYNAFVLNTNSKNVLALVKAFITKEKIGKYLDDLPDVKYDFKAKPGKETSRSPTIADIGAGIYYLSVTTVAVCMVINLLKSNKVI